MAVEKIVIKNLWGKPTAEVYTNGKQERPFAGVKFQEHHLTDASFYKMDLRGADFSDATLSGAVFNECDLSDATFAEAQLYTARFDNCTAAGANFRECDMRKTRWFKTDSLKALFEQANAEDAMFRECKMDYVYFRRANLVDAGMKDCVLKNANFGWARLENCDFERSNLAGAIFNESDMRKAGFSACNLKGIKHEVIRAIEPIPIMQQIDKEIDSGNGELHMRNWHSEGCKTTHCIGGWVCFLHPAGKFLEPLIGTNAAAAFILTACGYEVPDFYMDNRSGMNWIKAQAKKSVTKHFEK